MSMQSDSSDFPMTGLVAFSAPFLAPLPPADLLQCSRLSTCTLSYSHALNIIYLWMTSKSTPLLLYPEVQTYLSNYLLAFPLKCLIKMSNVTCLKQNQLFFPSSQFILPRVFPISVNGIFICPTAHMQLSASPIGTYKICLQSGYCSPFSTATSQSKWPPSSLDYQDSLISLQLPLFFILVHSPHSSLSDFSKMKIKLYDVPPQNF